MSLFEAIELAAARLEAARSAAPASGGHSSQTSYNCTNSSSKKPGYKRGKVKDGRGWTHEVGDAQGRSWINCGNGVLRYSEGDLTGQEAKAAYTLRGWVVDFINYFGRKHCAFLTMTDAHNLHPREFAKRFHSWRTHEGQWIIGYIRILEPQLRGAPHYHLLVSVKWDMLPDRFDWPSFWEADRAYQAKDMATHHAARRRYKESAAPEAVALWGRMRKTLPKYGLGRAEFLPLRKEAEAVAGYLGKYLDKSLMVRIDDWKGCRRVERDRKSAKLWSRHNREFAWVSEGGSRWRKRIGELAEALGIMEYDEFQERYGPRWAFHVRERVLIATDEEWQHALGQLRAFPELRQT